MGSPSTPSTGSGTEGSKVQELDPYHEVGDVEALAKKLEAICSRPLERIKYDMGKYDWDRIAKEVSSIYETL